ncbi:MAG: hypothetical protein JWN84_3528 [Nocardioides sp.]|nr:hypothetical protein [Nocardioides sp.]
MSARTEAYPAVVRGASKCFFVLLVGGLVHPAVSVIWSPLGFVWLLLVAVVAFVWGSVAATPAGTPVEGWRRAPVAAVIGYALIVPLVITAAGELPLLQAVLTVATAVVVGAVVGLARTHYYASGPTVRMMRHRPASDV